MIKRSLSFVRCHFTAYRQDTERQSYVTKFTEEFVTELETETTAYDWLADTWAARAKAPAEVTWRREQIADL